MRITKGVLLCGALLVSTPVSSQANLPSPFGEPQCGKPSQKNTDPNAKPSDIMKYPPYVYYREQALEIYLAVEKFSGGAPQFFPILKYDEHRNWVRIYRVSGRKDGKPIQPVKIDGRLVHPSVGERALSMRIDKCDGRISEMKYIRPRPE